MSKQMSKAARIIYEENSTGSINKGTLKALKYRGFLGEDDILNAFGRRYVLAGMSLPKQCAELAIELEQIELSYEGRPENAVLAHYKALGYFGVSNEGTGILVVL